MELNKTPRWYYLLIGFLGLLVLSLGVWWLYLLTVFAKMLGPEQARTLKMLRWEGSTFIILLIIGASSIAILYWRDLSKNRALQALFASLTHELKTPLASMRLQAEVIRDLIADESHDHAQLTALTTRLIQDTSKFEHELDKGLQLSRIEGQGTLTLSPIDLPRFIKRIVSKQNLEVNIKGSGTILADEMALSMVFRNLLENTVRHSGSNKVTINLSSLSEELICTYDDHGKNFTGNHHQLGHLFYKHASTKGTGIGLYLIKKLMQSQQGQLVVSTNGPLKFHLHFKSSPEEVG